jgi:hypothetical protein
MIQRRAAELGMKVKIGCHTFRATGITSYLQAGQRLRITIGGCCKFKLAPHQRGRSWKGGRNMPRRAANGCGQASQHDRARRNVARFSYTLRAFLPW